MDVSELALDAGALYGLALAVIRTGAFVLASPLAGRALPGSGRIGISIALGLFFARPVEADPSLTVLVAAAGVNAFVGALLGWATGVLFSMFAAAGEIIDLTSALAASALYDPTSGMQAAVFSRFFNLTALALFMVTGGPEVIVRAIDLSVRTVPLNGSVVLDPDLGGVLIDLVGRLVLAGAELALPVLSALFILELLLALASRFAPQSNILIIGLAPKVLVAILLSSSTLLLFPEALRGYLASFEEVATTVLRGLGA